MCGHGALHLRLDPEQFLHMMPDLMRQNIGLREISGRTKTSLQFVVKTQVDINLLVVGTVERPSRTVPCRRRNRRHRGRARAWRGGTIVPAAETFASTCAACHRERMRRNALPALRLRR